MAPRRPEPARSGPPGGFERTRYFELRPAVATRWAPESKKASASILDRGSMFAAGAGDGAGVVADHASGESRLVTDARRGKRCC